MEITSLSTYCRSPSNQQQGSNIREDSPQSLVELSGRSVASAEKFIQHRRACSPTAAPGVTFFEVQHSVTRFKACVLHIHMPVFLFLSSPALFLFEPVLSTVQTEELGLCEVLVFARDRWLRRSCAHLSSRKDESHGTDLKFCTCVRVNESFL